MFDMTYYQDLNLQDQFANLGLFQKCIYLYLQLHFVTMAYLLLICSNLLEILDVLPNIIFYLLLCCISKISFSSIIGLLIGTLIAFNVIIGDLAPSIFQSLSGVQVLYALTSLFFIPLFLSL